MTYLLLNLWSGAKNTPGLDILVSSISTVCDLFFNQSRNPCPACLLKVEENTRG